MNSETPIIQVKGIGDKTRALYAKLNIETVGDLLYTFPRDYETYEQPAKVSELKSGSVFAVYACVVGIPSEKKIRKLTILNVHVSDGTGMLQLTFFNMPFLKKTLKQGAYYIFRGTVSTRGAAFIMEQPKIFRYDEYLDQCNKLLPRYSLTKGLTNQAFQKVIRTVLSQYTFEAEYLPETILNEYRLATEKEALESIHYPGSTDAIIQARTRLVFDEFFSFLYQMKLNKASNCEMENAYQMFETADTVRFLEQLPYELTKAQKKVWQEIREDLGSHHCMNRLIQGDVGSGKTILAVLALLMTAANGYQGAMMAPTEVLAVQHYEAIKEYIASYHINLSPVLLVGSMTAREKRDAYTKIQSGEANIIIGTHAIIQEKVTYNSLALVITDEQHRFGVNQREALAQKGKNPHILVMSATPIPRTLAIILYGDLQISVIDELPTGRLPIKNCVVNTSYRSKAYEFISKQVADGRQVYVICPQVEEGELDDLENVIDYTEKLRQHLPASIQISYLHGKMKASDKNRIMNDFSAHCIDILVSTTVIEVGINVPNATVMMVENAERFGLAQLHQLRGRVGRGVHQSYCIFVSSKEGEDTMKRLEILNQSNDGFFIASQDLKLRGPGDLFGIRQSGAFAFRLGDIYTDAQVLKNASDAVEKLLNAEAESVQEMHQKIISHLCSGRRNTVDFRSI